jgi:hypothetical protein
VTFAFFFQDIWSFQNMVLGSATSHTSTNTSMIVLVRCNTCSCVSAASYSLPSLTHLSVAHQLPIELLSTRDRYGQWCYNCPYSDHACACEAHPPLSFGPPHLFIDENGDRASRQPDGEHEKCLTRKVLLCDRQPPCFSSCNCHLQLTCARLLVISPSTSLSTLARPLSKLLYNTDQYNKPITYLNISLRYILQYG